MPEVSLCNTYYMPKLELSEGLSLVIPAYNEGDELTVTLNSAIKAFEQAPIPFEILVVEDGSKNLHPEFQLLKNVRYIEKNHSGRIETIFHGINLAKNQNVLVIGARVRLRASAIQQLIQLNENYPTARFWNGMIYILNTELPHVSIWETLVRVGWSKGLQSETAISFGVQDFDLYPKGSGLFLASKQDWINGFSELREYAANSKINVSDDTRLLRGFAEISNIWFSKDFAADYKPRTSFKLFLKNAQYRGNTFVDSYWESSTIFGKLVRYLTPFTLAIALATLSLAGLTGLLYSIGTALILSKIVFFLYSFKTWKKPTRAAKEAFVLVPLILFFGFGFVRAYVLGFQSRRNS
jgi:glycosyltransferase involved in cell wall biosynthesis